MTVAAALASAGTGGSAMAATAAVASLRTSPRSEKDTAAGSDTGEGSTQETGTPVTRSLSPSSDGGASPAPSDFGAAAGSSSGGTAVGTGGRSGEILCLAAATGEAFAEVPRVASGSPAVRLAAEPSSASLEEALGSSVEGGGEDIQDLAVADRQEDDATASTTARRSGVRESRAKGAGRPGLGSPSAGPAAKGAGRGWGRGVLVCQPVLLPGSPVVPSNSNSDRRIIEALAASEKMHNRLVRIAHGVPDILAHIGEDRVASSTELYGSLALENLRERDQDFAGYYVNKYSDIDYVVDMPPGVKPQAVADRFLRRGPWKLVGQVQVHKFASTQFTLLGRFDDDSDSEKRTDEEAAKDEAKDEQGSDETSSTTASRQTEEPQGSDSASSSASSDEKLAAKRYTEVFLDITCIESPVHCRRFKRRQKAFRDTFSNIRRNVEAKFGPQGGLAFNAYVHLLKAFAAKLRGNALTGFQATCIGLFTLQCGYFKLKSTLSIALSFFEGFLQFCSSFYGEHHTLWNYRHLALDLTCGGRLLPRQSAIWRSEIYFMHAEETMNCPVEERVNVAHSLDPALVSKEAALLHRRTFSGDSAGLMFAQVVASSG